MNSKENQRFIFSSQKGYLIHHIQRHDAKQKSQIDAKKKFNNSKLSKFFLKNYSSEKLFRNLQIQSQSNNIRLRKDLSFKKKASQIIHFVNKDYYQVKKNLEKVKNKLFSNLQIVSPNNKKILQKQIVLSKNDYQEKCQKNVIFKKNYEMIFKIQLKKNLDQISLRFVPKIQHNNVMKSYDNFQSSVPISDLDFIQAQENKKKHEYIYIKIQSFVDQFFVVKFLFRSKRKNQSIFDRRRESSFNNDKNSFQDEMDYSQLLEANQKNELQKLKESRQKKKKLTNFQKIQEIKDFFEKRESIINSVNEKKLNLTKLQQYQKVIRKSKIEILKFNVYQKEKCEHQKSIIKIQRELLHKDLKKNLAIKFSQVQGKETNTKELVDFKVLQELYIQLRQKKISKNKFQKNSASNLKSKTQLMAIVKKQQVNLQCIDTIKITLQVFYIKLNLRQKFLENQYKFTQIQKRFRLFMRNKKSSLKIIESTIYFMYLKLRQAFKNTQKDTYIFEDNIKFGQEEKSALSSYLFDMQHCSFLVLKKPSMKTRLEKITKMYQKKYKDIHKKLQKEIDNQKFVDFRRFYLQQTKDYELREKSFIIEQPNYKELNKVDMEAHQKKLLQRVSEIMTKNTIFQFRMNELQALKIMMKIEQNCEITINEEELLRIEQYFIQNDLTNNSNNAIILDEQEALSIIQHNQNENLYQSTKDFNFYQTMKEFAKFTQKDKKQTSESINLMSIKDFCEECIQEEKKGFQKVVSISKNNLVKNLNKKQLSFVHFLIFFIRIKKLNSVCLYIQNFLINYNNKTKWILFLEFKNSEIVFNLFRSQFDSNQNSSQIFFFSSTENFPTDTQIKAIEFYFQKTYGWKDDLKSLQFNKFDLSTQIFDILNGLQTIENYLSTQPNSIQDKIVKRVLLDINSFQIYNQICIDFQDKDFLQREMKFEQILKANEFQNQNDKAQIKNFNQYYF